MSRKNKKFPKSNAQGYQNNLSDMEIKILAEVKKQGLSQTEIRTILKNMRSVNPAKYAGKNISFSDDKVRFGIFSDAHIGHKNYRSDIMRHLIKNGQRYGVEFWVNPGDTLEGMSNREGHIFELDQVGYTAQLNKFAQEFSQFKVPVYSIEAQNSHSGWIKNKGNQGLDIGEILDSKAKQYDFLGFDEQDLRLDNGLVIRLRHPGGGSAYALSYKSQKYIEALPSGKKPHILTTGHFHKMFYMYHRNIHSIDAGALQEQSPFMKKIGTPSHIGYWLCEATMRKGRKKGLEDLTVKMVSFYE